MTGEKLWEQQRQVIKELKDENIEKAEEIKTLKGWINGLPQLYVNCVYCGHRFKPNPEVFPSQTDVVREHMEKCSKHPLFQANQKIKELKKVIEELEKRLVV